MGRALVLALWPLPPRSRPQVRRSLCSTFESPDRCNGTHHAGCPPRVDHQRQLSTTEARRILTGLDGTVNVRLSPGNYTVESDEPLVFQGQAYHWRQTLDIVAGRDSALDLTLANAVDEPIAAGATNADTRPSNRHLAAAAAVARQRRRAVDSDCTRVGIPGRFGRTHCHEPESRWRRDVRRGAALPVDQSRGNRRRGRSSARHCRDPDQPHRHGVDRAGAAWMPGQPPAARLRRAGDLRAGRASWPEQGVDARIHEPHRRTRVPGPTCRSARAGREDRCSPPRVTSSD